jgi:hypothetical protein
MPTRRKGSILNAFFPLSVLRLPMVFNPWHIEQCSGDLNDLLERPDRLPPVQRLEKRKASARLEGNPEAQPSKVPKREHSAGRAGSCLNHTL